MCVGGQGDLVFSVLTWNLSLRRRGTGTDTDIRVECGGGKSSLQLTFLALAQPRVLGLGERSAP